MLSLKIRVSVERRELVPEERRSRLLLARAREREQGRTRTAGAGSFRGDLNAA